MWDSKYCSYQAILTIGLLQSATIVGSFKKDITNKAIPERPITIIHTFNKNIMILTGGKDGQQKVGSQSQKDQSIKFIQLDGYSIKFYQNYSFVYRQISILGVQILELKISELVGGCGKGTVQLMKPQKLIQLIGFQRQIQ
ncbi:unnamed protein product [Paramecium sonneborni]|uniref:Uncharacterized protein n=1 Tax=Paramecium sonneborni TaxID=65129 RepID=A0A8S1R625_9CILI|nr:unnamed protein product [Paramecium sonneborni]